VFCILVCATDDHVHAAPLAHRYLAETCTRVVIVSPGTLWLRAWHSDTHQNNDNTASRRRGLLGYLGVKDPHSCGGQQVRVV
jgi:hypothetical protein